MNNGYIEVDINGQRIGLKFAYPAFRFFFEGVSENYDFFTYGEGASTFTVESLAKMMQAGHVNNCFLKEIKPFITYEQFYLFCEEAYENKERAKLINEVFSTFMESSFVKKTIGGLTESEEDESKKKEMSTGMK